MLDEREWWEDRLVRVEAGASLCVLVNMKGRFGVTHPDSINLVESLTALSTLWSEMNDPHEKPRPFHVTLSPVDQRLIVVQTQPGDVDGEEVVMNHLELLILTELGYAGVMQWKGDYSLLFLTPEGIDFSDNTDRALREQRRQHLLDKLNERQGRAS